MRINFLRFAAIIIAIGTFAFTTVENKAQEDMFVFEYDPTASGGYAVVDVEDISNANWKYVGKNLSLCSDNDQRACRVAVIGDYVDNVTTPTALQNVTIDATLSGSTAHLIDISGTDSQFSNQAE